MKPKVDRVTGATICQDCGKFIVRIGTLMVCDCEITQHEHRPMTPDEQEISDDIAGIFG